MPCCYLLRGNRECVGRNEVGMVRGGGGVARGPRRTARRKCSAAVNVASKGRSDYAVAVDFVSLLAWHDGKARIMPERDFGAVCQNGRSRKGRVFQVKTRCVAWRKKPGGRFGRPASRDGLPSRRGCQIGTFFVAVLQNWPSLCARSTKPRLIHARRLDGAAGASAQQVGIDRPAPIGREQGRWV